jgi:hypothetical protein
VSFNIAFWQVIYDWRAILTLAVFTAMIGLWVALAPTRQRVWVGVAVVSFVLLCIFMYRLALVLPSANFLSWTYLIYALVLVVFIHSIFFALEATLAKTDRHLWKTVPKWLEYAYTVVVAMSLFQIFFYGSRMADYVIWRWGDETYLGNQIKLIAEAYLHNECINLGAKSQRESVYDIFLNMHVIENVQFYFTPEYCAKLKGIVDASNTQEYILHSVIADRQFVDHIIEEVYPIDMGTRYEQSSEEFGQVEMGFLQSPIRELVHQFETVHEYIVMKAEAESAGSNVFAWVGMLLLPLGIALRGVKTSLELFVFR